jgi:two-component system, OmpR family, sensor histidine kinase VanS
VRAPIRLRLTLVYVGLLVAATTIILGVSWWLVARHLDRTLPGVYADEVLRRLATQYGLAVAGSALLALGLGWLAAGRILAPLRAIAATAREVSQDRLDARVELDGPDDEVQEVASAFDAMLDRLAGAVDAQRRFVANASHELRTPLTVMRTEAEEALDDPRVTPQRLREVALTVVETTDRTERLLDGLLVLAATTRGVRRDGLVDLGGVARRAVHAAEHEAGAAGVRLRAALEPVAVSGDEALLERLAGNLLENAVRHGTPGGDVRLVVHRHGDEAVLAVENGGERIEPAALARLTQPFERLHRTRAHGTGLGLSIVAAVAEAHGGTLRLDARPAGGLEAEVRLPAAAVTAR